MGGGRAKQPCSLAYASDSLAPRSALAVQHLSQRKELPSQRHTSCCLMWKQIAWHHMKLPHILCILLVHTCMAFTTAAPTCGQPATAQGKLAQGRECRQCADMEGAAIGGPAIHIQLLQCSEPAQAWRAAGAVGKRHGRAGCKGGQHLSAWTAM
jgi:hypothetical protein